MMQIPQLTGAGIDGGTNHLSSIGDLSLTKIWDQSYSPGSASSKTHGDEVAESSRLGRSSANLLELDWDILEELFDKRGTLDWVLADHHVELLGNHILSFATELTASSTSSSEDLVRYHDAKAVLSEVQNLFSLATFINLEPGMENSFSEGLEQVIERFGDGALDEIRELILNEETKSAIAMEALQYIGRSDCKRWRVSRRRVLERCLLESRSAWIRDGAGLGLASLDDPQSIESLEKAIAKETSSVLQNDLRLVLNQLKDTLSGS